MGRTYGVPRSAKGESRILYIFTIKSLAITLAFAAIGWGLSFLVKMFVELSLIGTLIFIVPFAGIGFIIGATKIPDSPMLGPLQKAGGEYVYDILLRLLTFKSKKKIYIYGLTREVNKKKEGSNVSKKTIDASMKNKKI